MSFPSSEICILLLSANPKGSLPLRLEEEKREIESGLERSQYRDRFRLVKKEAVRNRDLQRAMLDLTPQVVHFSGHGTGAPGLVFEDDIGQVKLIDAAALAGLFALFSDQLQCVVLNACYSELQAEAIAQHIPYVIGMSDAIGDRAAIEFAVGFYDALGAGRDIEFAHKLGCQSIRMTGIPENLIPVLKHRSNSLPIASTQLQDLPVPEVSSASLPASASRSALLGDRFLKPRRSKPIRYSWLLAGVAVACLGAIGLVPQVRETIGNREPDCFEKAVREKKLIVAIADFQSEGADAAKAPSIEGHLFDRLTTRLPEDTATCPITTVTPTNNSEAETLGKNLNAKIVIWGRIHSLGLEIYLTRIRTTPPGFNRLTLAKTDAEKFETQIQILPEVVYVMTANAVSDIYLQEKSNAAARKVLKDALDWIEWKNLNLKEQNIAERLANAYFALGDLYNPSDPSEWNCSTVRENCLNAIKAYQRSAEINPQNQRAVISQGGLYERMENNLQAIKIYSQIIQTNPNSGISLEARGYRASIYYKTGKIQQAIQDIRIMCDRYPNNYEWLSYLGKSYVRDGHLEEAKNTYLKLKQQFFQDQIKRDRVIDQLKLLIKEYPQTRSVAEKILANLN